MQLFEICWLFPLVLIAYNYQHMFTHPFMQAQAEQYFLNSRISSRPWGEIIPYHGPTIVYLHIIRPLLPEPYPYVLDFGV